MLEKTPDYREYFNIDDNISYLNSAYMGLLPKSSVQKGNYGFELKSKSWEIQWNDFYDKPENTRKLFSKLINADNDSVFFVPSASYGFSVFANNFKLDHRKTILLLEEEFPSNVWIWKELAKNQNGNVKFVRRPDDDDWTSAILNDLNADTALVSVPNCHWTDGGLINLEILSKELREKNISLAIDGTQSVGVMPIDLQKIKPDFMVVSGYKWCLGPYSLGLAYIDSKYHSGEPIEYNWLSKLPMPADSKFPDMTAYDEFEFENARKFDFGQRGNFHLIPALESSLQLITNIGPENIYKYVDNLNEEIIKSTSEMGFSNIVRNLRARHYLGLRFENEIPNNFVENLAKENVFISARGKKAIRVTPHIWNNLNDIDKFLNALKRVL
ncbi:MAG: aminotransferase [Chloroflexi bacterium]|nr:aminotransferase [Chloroflexota bacterium]MBK90658.1 aminotransferase [Chloroflexota bacterium]|tara:strand:+ start:37731 stop:38885 length:1155 start_codon:yes stop_codon:yes gene_type:complete